MRSRLLPVDNSLLGMPFGYQDSLPTAIAERWNRGTNQTISTGVFTTIQYGSNNYNVQTSGYAPLYSDTSNRWTIPSGLGGVWMLLGAVQFASNTTGHRTVQVLLNGTTDIYQYRLPTQSAGAGALSLPVVMTWDFAEGDYFEVRVNQNSGGNLDIQGGSELTHLTATFVGVT